MKMGEDLKKHLVKEGMEIVKRHPKISSTSYITRELQTKTPVRNAHLQKMAEKLGGCRGPGAGMSPCTRHSYLLLLMPPAACPGPRATCRLTAEDAQAGSGAPPLTNAVLFVAVPCVFIV